MTPLRKHTKNMSINCYRRSNGANIALAIGLTVALDALWGGPISGASMNPARSFGPALIAGIWEHQWVYLLAPTFGAAIGAALYQWIREPQKNLQETG